VIRPDADIIGHQPVYKRIDLNPSRPPAPSQPSVQTAEDIRRLKEGERIWKLIRHVNGDIVEPDEPEPAPQTEATEDIIDYYSMGVFF
jgi:hypothetical protein